MSFKKNTAVTGFTVGLVSSTDGSDITTGTPVGYYTLDGGTQTAIGDVTPTHEGNGQWSFDLTAAEMNGDIVGLAFTHTSAITAHFTIKTEATLVSDLNDLSAAQVNAECDTALADYDGPTNAEMVARTLAAADYFDPATDTVANVTTVATTTTNTDMVDVSALATSAALATVDSNVDAVLVDTGTTIPAQITALNDFDPAVDTVALVTTTTNVTNQVTADVTAISGDTVSADNLELQFDGTGLTGDTFPSTQSQLNTLTNVGSAVHSAASTYVLTTGTQTANLYTDTEALDDVRHTHTDAAGAVDFYYEHVIGAGTPSSVQITGAVTGSNDSVGVYGYNWSTTSWVQVGTFSGTNSTANRVEAFDLFTSMVGTGTDKGKVRIRFYEVSGLSSATIYVDQIFVAYSAGAEGYDNGAVWFNSNATNTGTVVGVDGTSGNPISTSASLLTLLTATGLRKIEVMSGSTLTLGGAYEGYSFNGNGSILALGSQDVGGTVFSRFGSATGVATSTGDVVFFEDCIFGTATLPPYVARHCGYGATVSQSGAGDYTHVDCYSVVAGAGSPTFSRTGAGVVTGEYRRFSGGITQSGITGSDTFTIGGEMGTVTLNGANGVVELRGTYKAVTDSRSGSPTLNLDGAILGGDVASIKQVTDLGVRGAAIAGTLSTTEMTTDLTEVTDDHYIGRLLTFTTGVLTGQQTDVTAYAGATKKLTFTTLTDAPSAGDDFILS